MLETAGKEEGGDSGEARRQLKHPFGYPHWPTAEGGVGFLTAGSQPILTDHLYPQVKVKAWLQMAPFLSTNSMPTPTLPTMTLSRKSKQPGG